MLIICDKTKLFHQEIFSKDLQFDHFSCYGSEIALKGNK